ncbi:alanine dehydrogenase [Helicobacter sp. 12S02232-10]|uniref:alanine dehydrogenase n=1 Tax=Helicobacter sp. 12S02232-10 TaxID=1476197 RepID=UPI000BA5A8FA|nr:alanine dehydrogenase [Helicobacter sp. 12S02232-10]PAF47210.1 alanine dehydrogenase [Helicobacter sp. 12S02232-10]
MIIGIPKEIMNHEHRVGLIPSDVARLKQSDINHQILVQAGLGEEIGFSDAMYQEAGAKIVPEAKEVWEKSQLLVKCKEPLESEYKYLRKDMILYSFLDLAYSKELAQALVDSKITSICGETIPGPKNNYPILAPMSEVAGKLAAQLVAEYFCTHRGGRGILIGGCAGVPPAKVVVLGGGVVGMNAAKTLVGMGADVWVLDIDVHKVSSHPLVVSNKVKLLYATEEGIRTALKGADGIVGAVLVTATQTPKVIKREHLKLMNQGGVIIDVACDLGGCIETIHQTTHDDPTYYVDGILHYGVPNMPGVVAKTSSICYSNESMPYVLSIANKGWKEMLKMPGALEGLNAYDGKIGLKTVATAFGLPYIDAKTLIG